MLGALITLAMLYCNQKFKWWTCALPSPSSGLCNRMYIKCLSHQIIIQVGVRISIRDTYLILHFFACSFIISPWLTSIGIREAFGRTIYWMLSATFLSFLRLLQFWFCFHHCDEYVFIVDVLHFMFNCPLKNQTLTQLLTFGKFHERLDSTRWK